MELNCTLGVICLYSVIFKNFYVDMVLHTCGDTDACFTYSIAYM